MGRPPQTPKPTTCVTCEIEIVGPATFHDGLPFCCAGCTAGGPCMCSYDRVGAAGSIRHCLDVRGAMSRPAAGEVAAKRGAGLRSAASAPT